MKMNEKNIENKNKIVILLNNKKKELEQLEKL
jgi:hypothetical protein